MWSMISACYCGALLWRSAITWRNDRIPRTMTWHSARLARLYGMPLAYATYHNVFHGRNQQNKSDGQACRACQLHWETGGREGLQSQPGWTLPQNLGGGCEGTPKLMQWRREIMQIVKNLAHEIAGFQLLHVRPCELCWRHNPYCLKRLTSGSFLIVRLAIVYESVTQKELIGFKLQHDADFCVNFEWMGLFSMLVWNASQVKAGLSSTTLSFSLSEHGVQEFSNSSSRKRNRSNSEEEENRILSR